MRKQIIFTAPGKAELLETPLPTAAPDSVTVSMEYTVISSGTEKAALLNLPNSPGGSFPRCEGYCGVGRVTEAGPAVDILPGSRVLVYHGVHSNWNVVPAANVTPVLDSALPSLDAAFVILASMGLGGVRKARLEIGESAMVMGLGLLGMFAVQFCRLNGAYPVIAADPNPERRALALQLGADAVLDPLDPDFTEQARSLTGGKGIRATVEVSGSSAAMRQALDCAAFQGRIVLLGCTRVSDCAVDYYRQIHKPGIELIGAHNFVRPKSESYPHHWTHQDDCAAILRLLSAGRIQAAPLCSAVESPLRAPEIYVRLAEDPKFPLGIVFDWRLPLP